MSKICLLALLFAVAVSVVYADQVKTYICEGFYGCEKCCPHLGSGCSKFQKSPFWFGSYSEICTCSCPNGASLNLGGSIKELSFNK